jgi:head-tail adaptor
MNARPFIGAMRYRMRIELPVDTPDGFGGSTRSYVAGATVAAQLRSYPNNHHVVLMRRRADVTPEVRLRYRRRLFQVVSVDRIDRYTTFVQVSCEELRPCDQPMQTAI